MAYPRIPIPRVTMSDACGLVPRLPMATTPVNTPSAAAAKVARISARTCGMPAPSNVAAVNAAKTEKVPCARFTTRVTR